MEPPEYRVMYCTQLLRGCWAALGLSAWPSKHNPADNYELAQKRCPSRDSYTHRKRASTKRSQTVRQQPIDHVLVSDLSALQPAPGGLFKPAGRAALPDRPASRPRPTPVALATRAAGEAARLHGLLQREIALQARHNNLNTKP